jgi:DNA-3-methyladenine glycosylase I
MPPKIARYDARRKAKLLGNPGIVRNRLKVEAAVLKREGLSQSSRGIRHIRSLHLAIRRWRAQTEPLQVDERRASAHGGVGHHEQGLAPARGFKFVGSTICYAYMQAVGMVNDHLVSCFRHAEIEGKRDRKHRKSNRLVDACTFQTRRLN